MGVEGRPGRAGRGNMAAGQDHHRALRHQHHQHHLQRRVGRLDQNQLRASHPDVHWVPAGQWRVIPRPRRGLLRLEQGHDHVRARGGQHPQHAAEHLDQVQLRPQVALVQQPDQGQVPLRAGQLDDQAAQPHVDGQGDRGGLGKRVSAEHRGQQRTDCVAHPDQQEGTHQHGLCQCKQQQNDY